MHKTTEDKRSIQLDILRIAAAFTVIWLHTSAAVVLKPNPGYGDFVWWIGNIADSASRWTVPFFVMISGALLLGNTDTKTGAMDFYTRRTAKLFIPIVFWSCIYMLYRVYHDNAKLVWVLKDFAKGAPFYHLWFLFMLLGLYAVTPLLRVIVANISHNALIVTVSAIFLTTFIEETTAFISNKHAAHTFLLLWLPYTAYFLAGFILKNLQYRMRTTSVILTSLFLFGLVAAQTAFIRFSFSREDVYDFTYSSFNPIIVCVSLILFAYFSNLPLSVSEQARLRIQSVSGLTLGIYIVHPLWLEYLRNAGLDGFIFTPLIGIPLTASAVFILSLGTTYLLRFTPALRRTV